MAVVGAGPAGCLLAIALLDAAQVRRRPLQVIVFHGGGSAEGSVLLDAAAITRLGACGVQLPEAATAPLRGVRAIKGRAIAEQPTPLFSLPRAVLLERLRAAAQERGAQIVDRAVDTIHPTPDGGCTVRAAGASMRAEAVVLACGAGSPLATRILDHQPPPLWRSCAAELSAAPGDPGVGPWAERVHGADALPDLWLFGADGERLHGGEHALAIGEDVGPSAMAEGLLAAVASGRVPPLHLREPRRVFLPAGVARPALPAIGDALGGAPVPWRLARASAQAHALAAAFFDGGPQAMLECTRAEALRLDADVRRSLRGMRRWKGRPAALVERAVAREQGRSPSWQPVGRALSASAAPAESGPRDLLLALWALVAFALAWIVVACERLVRRGPAHAPAPSDRVFVVDDDADQAALVCEYLEGRGVRCVPFLDGMAAVAAAAHERPAAVVLDVALPWLDGSTVCRTLRQHANIPVFLATALPLSLARPEGDAAGATAVLAKPLDLAGLALRLQAWVPVGPPAEPRSVVHRAAAGQADAAQPPR